MPDVLTDPEVVEFFGRAARKARHVIAVRGGALLAGAAELRGTAAAQRAELDIQYTPRAPFGTGSPALAGPDMTRASINAYGMAPAYQHALDTMPATA
jgi:hypothetical protein